MPDRKPDSARTARSWDTYWRGTGDAGSYSAGGASHPVLFEFWKTFFRTVELTYESPRMADVASGSGAVVERALESIGADRIDITCIDASEAAIRNIVERFSDIDGLVCDARSIPLASGGFDVVTSQFGVEYAGLEAVHEAARLLAPGGVMALLIHCRPGSIHDECTQALAAIDEVRDSKFLPCAIEMFRHGFEAVRGADRAPYDEAAKRLSPAVEKLEDVIRQYGDHVAGGMIARLYSDVGRVHSRIQHYDPSEVLAWLERMDDEMDDYIGRMSSMIECSIDRDTFDRLRTGLQDQDYTVEEATPIFAPGSDVALAWALIVTRQ